MSEGAVRWDGPVPDHIIENLQRGVAPHEKRVVANLANISRIMLPDESVRIYEDFVSDWRYDRSEFVHDETCTLCGKKHIREACHIIDDVQGLDIVVGNECVYKHIEIITDGVEGLTGDAKKDYLKTQMANAKDRFFTAKFVKDFPKAREYLDGVIEHDWLYAKTDIAYAKRALRMINSRGYISRRTSTYDWFEEIDLEEAIAERETHLTKFKTMHTTATSSHVVTVNQKNFMATKFRTMAEKQVDLGWLKDASQIALVESKIRRYGVNGLRYGSKTFYDRVIRMDEEGGPQPCVADGILTSPRFSELTEWEQGFVKSVSEQFHSRGYLSDKQEAILTKITKKVEGASA